MLEDKYIGLIIALSGSVGIGSSFILTKKVRRISISVYYPQLV